MIVKIHDISLTIHPDAVPVWPGDPQLELTRFLSLDRGESVNASRLTCSVHMGTHVDAAAHHFAEGGGTDSLSLDALIGVAYVLDCGEAEAVDSTLLDAAQLPSGVRRLLFRTTNSALWNNLPTSRFHKNFVALTPDAAEWIVDAGVQLVGIDYMSIERFGAEAPVVHRTLLKAGVVIVEGLDLRKVQSGTYELICLPLKLAECDGAPARVVLLERT